MKKYLFFVLFSFFMINSYSQDCSGGRYHDLIFTELTEIKNVQYGTNLDQAGQNSVSLFMDIYYPANDTETSRPLILLAHGGAFVDGNRTEVEGMCKAFAAAGFVSATIDYRLLDLLGPGLSQDGEMEFKKEIVRAMHDMRAAIRFFRKSYYEEDNPYGIDPDIVIVGGVSAGAILANQTTYLDKEYKIHNDIANYLEQQGGLEGNSGNPGYSSSTQMTISMCGAILDTTWIEQDSQPFLGLHNLDDPVVPNLSGYPWVIVEIPIYVYGDSLIHKRALNTGIDSGYKSYPGFSHCDFPSTSGEFIADFVHNQICNQSLSLQELVKTNYSIYPNPVEDVLTISIPENDERWNIQLMNEVGKIVNDLNLEPFEDVKQLNTSELAPGMYLIRLTSSSGEIGVKKIIVQ